VIDAGTGLVPASLDLFNEGVQHLVLLMTHYHHDHTQGLPLARHTFEKSVPIDMYGPHEHGIGPMEMLRTLMSAPFFPVDFSRVASHFNCHDLEAIGRHLLMVHPQRGARLLRVDEYEQILTQTARIPSAEQVLQDESLVVHMHKTVHPEYTVSYRFEERTSGKVAVVLTDHENTVNLPKDLRMHIDGANLLIQDAQYTRAQYQTTTSGFGHATGEYAARVMKECNVGRLGLTHHDPMSDDSIVNSIVDEARSWLIANGAPELADHVFACADYQEIEV
jgi:ribonuclease BN (tRNA processing enzyme)